MALRDYMQDLLRSQTCGEDEYARSDTVHIIIVDDNSCSSIPDECDECMSGNRSICDLPSANSSSRTLNCSSGGERDESTYDSSRRAMLDDFRRRKRFLRETLSPNANRLSSVITESPLSSSPSPIITRFTPIDCKGHGEVSQQPSPTDSQRDRMYRLKTNPQIQRDASSPLL